MIISYFKHSEAQRLLTITIDGEPWRDIHTAIFGRKPIFPSINSMKAWEEHFATIELQAAYRYALKRLSRKNHSSTELRGHLEKCLVSEQAIEHAIGQCKNHGYLNDQDWIEGFVRHHLAKQKGPNIIRQKLRAKGISSLDADAILHKLDCSESQQARIRHLLHTYYRKRDLSDYASRNKVVASLIRKGFSFTEIEAVLDDL